jgi:hypothetical protein
MISNLSGPAGHFKTAIEADARLLDERFLTSRDCQLPDVIRFGATAHDHPVAAIRDDQTPDAPAGTRENSLDDEAWQVAVVWSGVAHGAENPRN